MEHSFLELGTEINRKKQVIANSTGMLVILQENVLCPIVEQTSESTLIPLSSRFSVSITSSRASVEQIVQGR